MNLTIPIRAENSKRSWTRDMRGNRTRYIFSITTALLLVSMLLMGSIDGIVQGASAKSNYNNRSGYTTTQNRGANSGSNNLNQAKPTPTPAPTPANTTVTPTKTTTTPTTPPAATPATTTPAPAVAPTATQTASPKVETQTVAPPEPVDTAPAINSMAAAQTDKNTEPVTYTSQKISDDTRNHIFILAGVAAVTGALLYTISFIGAAAPAMKREIPIRYIVPVREGISI